MRPPDDDAPPGESAPDGVPTFPWSFASLDGPDADLTRASAVILPAPYDGTVSYGPGARDGPRAIIEASRYLELFEPDLNLEPSQWGIATLSPVGVDVSGPEPNVNAIQRAVGALSDRGKLPVMLGGEHTLTIGAVRALAERHPGLSVLQLDAHADMRDSYMGSRYSHACTMRRVRETPGIGPVVQAGVRSMSSGERAYLRATGIDVPVYTERGLVDSAAIERLLEPLGGVVYVTVDLDALDPSIMPSVGTPEPGGLSWSEAVGVLRAVAERSRIVGCDVMEFAPGSGPTHAAYTAARLTYKLIGYSLATGPGARPVPK